MGIKCALFNNELDKKIVIYLYQEQTKIKVIQMIILAPTLNQ